MARITQTAATETTLSLAWPQALGGSAPLVYEVTTLAGTREESLAEVILDGLTPATRVAVSVRARDAQGQVTPALLSAFTTADTQGLLPPDPADVAPLILNSSPTDAWDALGFFVEGPVPVQFGVAPGAIERERATGVRGRITNGGGAAVVGARVDVIGDSAVGYTRSRPDGRYDLLINGGGTTRLRFTASGHLPVERTVTTQWLEFTELDDVVLTALDPVVTTVQLSAMTTPVTHFGSAVADGDGMRTASLTVRTGTSALMRFPDGSTSPLDTLSLRTTEYTVGPGGPLAMPAALPDTSMYTYCAELGVDEAQTVGATRVEFSQAVAFHVDNFLGVPVGQAVPVGALNRTRGTWEAENDGLVVGVVSVTGGLADVDVDGDGMAEDGTTLAALGMDDAEREALAARGAGTSVMRVPVMHFTPYDLNFAAAADRDIPAPELPRARVVDEPANKRVDCCKGGSMLSCESRALGETIAVAGTPYSLNYSSLRVPGRIGARTVDIPLLDAAPPPRLTRVVVDVTVAGRTERFLPSMTPGASLRFTWDGRDAYGRQVLGTWPVYTRISYEYPMSYWLPDDAARAFGIPSANTRGLHLDFLSRTISRGTGWSGTLENWDARAHGNLGGWTIDAHHAYDARTRTLFMGDGTRVTMDKLGWIARVFMGGFGASAVPTPYRTPVRALDAALDYVSGIAAAADGSVFVSDGRTVNRVDRDGMALTVAGRGDNEARGEGEEAINVYFNYIKRMVAAPDGSLLISDTHASNITNRILRLDPQGRLWFVAGLPPDFSGTVPAYLDNVPAVGANLNIVDMAAGPDGSIYISNGRALEVITPDGMRRFAYGDRNLPAVETPDGTLAGVNGSTNTGGIVYTPQGLVFTEATRPVSTYIFMLRRIAPNGVLETLMGGPGVTQTDDGRAAEVSASGMLFLAADREGTIYYGDAGLNRVRRLTTDGWVESLTGNGQRTATGFDGEMFGGAAATGSTYPISLGPTGRIYAHVGLSGSGGRVMEIAPTPDTPRRGEQLVPSPSGGLRYVFDVRGRHLRTEDAASRRPIMVFRYTDDGLAEIEDMRGITRVERDVSGTPVAIVGSSGERTSLAVGADGFLRALVDPDGAQHVFEYAGATGLLTVFMDPEGHVSNYQHDALGYLVTAVNPGGGSRTLDVVRTDTSEVSTVTDSTGRSTTYETIFGRDGTITRRENTPYGGGWQATQDRRGQRVETDENGVITTTTYGFAPSLGTYTPASNREERRTPGGLLQVATGVTTVQRADTANPGRVTSMQVLLSQDGAVTTRNLDFVTGVAEVISPAGRIRRAIPDAEGRIGTAVVDASLPPVQNTYDDDGNLVRVSQGPLFTDFTHDADGHLLTRTDALGAVTTYQRDSGGRITGVILPSGRTYGFEHDRDGSLVAVVMPSGDRHALARTPHHEIAAYTPPGGVAGTDVRDGFGGVLERRLARGDVITHVQDSGGRVVERRGPDITRGFTFEGPTLRPATMTSTLTGGATQTLVTQYDGPLVTGVAFSGPANGAFTYRYGPGWKLVGVTVDSDPELPVTHDLDGLVTRYGSTYFTRGGPTGRALQVTEGALVVDYTYDELGRVASRVHTVNGVEVYRLSVALDEVQRVQTLTEVTPAGTRERTAQYDVDGQLTAVLEGGTEVERYGTSINGGLVSIQRGGATRTVTVNAQDQPTGLDTVPRTYDDDGFLASRGADTFRYSADGELVRATVSGQDITYAHDAWGRRTARTDAAGTEQYLYGNISDPFQVTLVRHADGSRSRLVYGEDGHLVAVETEGTWFYVATDQVGTPQVITAADGTVVKQLTWSAFGEVLTDTAPAVRLLLGFAGGLLDPATGLVRFGFRDYDPTVGAWTARDPARFESGQPNLYAYSGNDPLSRVDPTGLACIGGSVFALVGFGFKVCMGMKDGRFRTSACGEVGLGAGGGVSVSDEEPPDTNLFAGAQLNLEAGPANASIEAGKEWGMDGPCSKRCAKAFLKAGPIEGGLVWNAYDPLNIHVENGLNHDKSIRRATHLLKAQSLDASRWAHHGSRMAVNTRLGVKAQVKVTAGACISND